MKIKMFFLIILGIIISGCSSMQTNTFDKNILSDENSTIEVFPFKNLSETPYAGIKAANIVEGVLRSKGFKVVQGYTINKDNEVILKSINTKYILKGEVNEWRYKTGIDGEPAVSVYVEILDKNGTIIYSTIGSRSDWGHKSVGICAQEIFESIF
jgi:hypothetical protein